MQRTARVYTCRRIEGGRGEGGERREEGREEGKEGIGEGEAYRDDGIDGSIEKTGLVCQEEGDGGSGFHGLYLYIQEEEKVEALGMMMIVMLMLMIVEVAVMGVGVGSVSGTQAATSTWPLASGPPFACADLKCIL